MDSTSDTSNKLTPQETNNNGPPVSLDSVDVLVDVDANHHQNALEAEGMVGKDIELVDVNDNKREMRRRKASEDAPRAEDPKEDETNLNLFQRFVLKNKIRLFNLWHSAWWLFWASCHFLYHQDKTKKSFNERNLFLGRTLESLFKATLALLILYGVLAALMTVALYCLSWGMFGNPVFDLNDRSWIPAGNPNSPN